MMLVVMLVLAIAVVGSLMMWLVSRDGYGLRPPPARTDAERQASSWPR